MNIVSSRDKDFRLEEFKILHGEVEQRAKEQRDMERNVVLLTGAIYAFLLTHPDALGSGAFDGQSAESLRPLKESCLALLKSGSLDALKAGCLNALKLGPLFDNWAWYLPPIINLLAFIRWRESGLLIELLAKYLRLVESNYLLPLKLEKEEEECANGWEAFLAQERRKERVPNIVSLTHKIFWIVVCAGPWLAPTLLSSGFANAAPQGLIPTICGLLCFISIAVVWRLARPRPDLA